MNYGVLCEMGKEKVCICVLVANVYLFPLYMFCFYVLSITIWQTTLHIWLWIYSNEFLIKVINKYHLIFLTTFGGQTSFPHPTSTWGMEMFIQP